MQSASEFYKEVYNSMLSSTKKVLATKELLSDLEKVFLEFSKGLEGFTDRFNKEIMKEAEGENEKLLKSFQIFSNSLLKVSDIFKKLSFNTKNAVIEPFSMFIQNYRDTNRHLSKDVNNCLVELEATKKELENLKSASYQGWIKSEKSRNEIEKAIEKIEKGGKNTDLVKANDNSLKLRINAEDIQTEYKNTVSKCNQLWKKTIKEFQNLCVLYQYNEESRLSFEKITFATALKLLGEAGLIQTNIDAKIKQSQDLLKGSSSKTSLLDRMRGNRKYRQLFVDEDKEVFITYEESKKEKEKEKEKGGKKEVHDPYKMISQKQREQIDELLNIWLNEKELIKVSKDFDKIRLQIISTSIYSFYFVDALHGKVQSMSQYYCKLEDQHFNQLLNVLSLISRSFENGTDRAYQELYKILNSSMRIMKKKKDKTRAPRELLSSSLGRSLKIFTNESVWMNILKYIKQKSDQSKKKSTVEKPTSMLKGGFAFFKGIGELVVGKKVEKEEDDSFQSIQELTTLMSNLAVPTQFSLPLLKKLLDGRQEAFELLKDVLYTKQDLQLRQKLLEPKQIMQRKINEQLAIFHDKTKTTWCLKEVSKSGFLDQKDIELRLVCQYLKNTHKFIIHKLDIPQKWLHILGCSVKDYIRMKVEVAENSVPSSVQQIITLDVNRSLHIHSQYLSPTMLHTLLRTFAYFNKNISYCQGMNYIAGYLFIKTRNEIEAYSVFQRMMFTHFNELFVNEFQNLKIKMYQFQRLMSIFLPELAEHFKRQMISSQCYIVSWIITLYSASYQYSMESYLVDFLWDRFVVWGWRQFFKFTLWVFNLYKEQLLELSFDKALHFLGELTKSDLFNANKQKLSANPKIEIDKIGEQINSFKISNKLLEELKKDYEVAKKMNMS